MNQINKLRGSVAGGGSGGGGVSVVPASDSPAEDPPNSPHTQLGLMHLKKLFTEYTHPKEPLSETERDYKLYNMLPLFCKVFGTPPTADMSKKFWDILAFCQQVSRLMVTEIRKRASNQSTETASVAIVKFLEIENCEESSNGWMLLSALNLLAAGDASLIQVMTNASIPSTLVKCLYLFFDLPEITEEKAIDDSSDFTFPERRILLQKVFVQLLVRLSSYPYPAEELARMDDLTLLFSAITTQCPNYNTIWRKSAAEVLTTISRHGLSEAILNYIHSKGCVALCIDNMQRVPKASPLEVVEMFVAVFCFLKDSSDISQILLDDFRLCQGYIFLSDFLLKLEQEQKMCTEAQAAMRNLVLLIASLCMCGFTELRPNPNQTNSLFQMQGFVMPQTSARGTSVRNIHAFQVLQTVFLKSSSTFLCCTTLDAIASVYHSDNANYFILETQNTLSQFTEKLHLKSPQIQEKFFELLEFIVFQLNFVPCKELISLSILLKSNHSISGSILCMRTLLNILKYNNVFKDVYREVGILEVFVTCITRYEFFLSTFIAEKGCDCDDELIGDNDVSQDANEPLGNLVIEALQLLLNSNNSNANVFRESGGSKCIHDMIKYRHCREKILGISRELILSSGGDDDMLFLLSTMHSTQSHKISLKIMIMKVLLGCLRDSHRTRTTFRKVGGFVYFTSVFVSLDGKLSDRFISNLKNDKLSETLENMAINNESEKTSSVEEMLQLLNIVCQTLATGMRFEPANAKFFHQICTTSLSDTLRLLGCFGTKVELDGRPVDNRGNGKLKYFHSIFVGNSLQSDYSTEMPPSLSFICLIYRLLYDLALDNFEKQNLSGLNGINFPNQSLTVDVNVKAENADPRNAIGSLNLTQSQPEPLIIHPGIVLCMLLLLPGVEHDTDEESGVALQIYLAEVIKSLVRSERNQQIMCDAGLPGVLLKIGRNVLSEEQNPLHEPLQYVLERLAAQALLPTELREFLRLGSPLQCENADLRKPYKPGGPVSLTRIKTLVSMTTPRDFRAYGSYTLPPFIEMDMVAEGFGCLFLPSVAPQAPNVSCSTDSTVIGGIGSGDRMFPPQSGLTYSTWFCVDKFSDPRNDPHCVRLLTLIRTVNNAREDNLVCLAILLSARDKAIIVSTQETMVPHNVGEWEPDGVGDNNGRIWCPDLLHEGQWHHLVVVLSRAVLKNSTCSLFLDGQHMHTQKLHFVSQNPGAGTTNLTVASSVYGFIGTPPSWRRYSKLCWKQGVCHLIEDVMTPQVVSIIYALGPHYMGSLQAPQPSKRTDLLSSLVPEERVMFGLNAKAMTQLTLAKIRKVYSKADNKTIARQLGMSSHENATPIRILHNSAGHLAGPARTLGGVVVGYLGVRIFSPHPVSAMIDTVGGCNVLLGIIAMAQTVESLYAGVKALTCVVKSNRMAQTEMDKKRSYQTLAMFFKKKKKLLNSHILHLTFSLVGTVNSGQETTAIPNIAAFQDLLCDLDVWQGAPNGLLRSLLEHLLELTSESNEKRANIKIMKELQLVSKLLFILQDITDHVTREILFALLTVFLGNQPRSHDLLLFGQFAASKVTSENEKNVDVAKGFKDKKMIELCEDGEITPETAVIKNIYLRNKCLAILHSLLFTVRNTVNDYVCDDISKILGLDWALLFMQPDIHSTTVVWACRLIVVLITNETIITRFREGTFNGGYLRYADNGAQNKSMAGLANTQLGATQMSANPDKQPVFSSQMSGEVKLSVQNVPGFQYLKWLLLEHLNNPELYFLTVALIVGQPVKMLATDNTKLDMESVWTFLWGAPISQIPISSVASKMNFCPEAVCILLDMIRTIINKTDNPVWLEEHPVTIIQVLFSLYHNLPEFMAVFMTADVINALVAILFPFGSTNESLTEVSSAPSSPDGLGEIFHSANKPKAPLTNHSVKKFVIDFLRVILVDSLSLMVTSKNAPVIDLIFDAAPEQSDHNQQVMYHTEVVTAIMDHLLAADVLVGEQAAVPIVPLLQSHSQNIAPNVFYFSARVVDKMWQACLSKDPHDIFDFIVKLIGQFKRRSGSVSSEQLHHSLNRTILFLLSRPTETVAEQMAVLETLHKLTTNRLLIFGAGNHELDFIANLTYCLMQLTADVKIILDPAGGRTNWHVGNADMIESRDEFLNFHQGKNLISTAACRVWEELYVCKKPAIEEVFKISLTNPASNARAPDLTLTREQIIESATKLWCNYVDAERKALYRMPSELHNQIQSKLQKVTGGLTRLASRTKVKKEDFARTPKARLEKTPTFHSTNNHLGVVRELWEMRCTQNAQMAQRTQRYIYQEWLQSENELTRERGIWGPVTASRLDKWTLDSTEGPHRMRKKTMKNDLFYLQYPYRPELELSDNRQLKCKVATSFDSKLHSIHCQQPSRILSEQEPVAEFDKTGTEPLDLSSNVTVPPPTLDRSRSEIGDDIDEDDDEVLMSDNQTLLRMLEEQEKISYIFRCARIQGLDTSEGLLLFGKEHCYLVDGFTLLKNREIRDIDTLPPGAYDPIIPCPGCQRRPQTIRQSSKFAYEEIREVHKRRYLLQPIALEVFSCDGRNYLLSFPRKVRNKVYQRFMSMATSIADSAQQSVAGQRRTASVEQASGILSNLIGETSVTQRWVRGEISNFQYLMNLNTLAGRSYNDLMQYPVFPWILADYESEELDLKSPKTFRDFSKPMGAQSTERLEQFQKRYKEWDDPHGETPPYHYGTHYSSAMIVCSYLVRLEPFTQHFLRLQGGHFDLADRMFHSIKEAWLSASRFNMADVKELIPEFFYLPEFLNNSNRFDLGVKQNGECLGDVILPPWAKHDPLEFIRVHRQALECDFVSNNLHLWIDLIFGYKQQGSLAADAVNVFHHLFYEGNVDIYNIEDPLKKNATIGFINNFGQIPKQLFKKAHPCKKMTSSKYSMIESNPLMSASVAHQADKLFFHNLDSLKPSTQPVRELKGPVGQIMHPDKSMLAVEQNKVLVPPTFSRYIAWGFADHSLRIGVYDSDRALIVCEAAAQYSGEILSCACPNSRTIITGGTSSVVTVWEFDPKLKCLTIEHSLYGHTDAVTCLAASTAYNVIVSGSRDGTAIVWDMSRYTFVRQLCDHVGIVASVCINDLTGDIATCSATWLHVWTINGDRLATVNTSIGSADRMQQILCVAFSSTREWDQQNVIITGSTDGVVRMWSMEYVQVPVEKIQKLTRQEPAIVDGEKSDKKFDFDLVKQISLSSEPTSAVAKSCSESSISEACDSFKESSKRFEIEKDECSDQETDAIPKQSESAEIVDADEPGKLVVGKRTNFASAKSLHDFKEETVKAQSASTEESTEHSSNINESQAGKSEEVAVNEFSSRGIRPSKSDTSLTDSFVVVNNEANKKAIINQSMLRDGFKWQRQLVFRSKLTMHTAYDRKDNIEPASITALAVSKDHKTLYVGDARGRVFSWSVTEQPGRGMADHWLKDEGTDECIGCHTRFTIYERKHHCRNCGQVFCSKCSRFESEISRLRIIKPVRVCQTCYLALQNNK